MALAPRNGEQAPADSFEHIGSGYMYDTAHGCSFPITPLQRLGYAWVGASTNQDGGAWPSFTPAPPYESYCPIGPPSSSSTFSPTGTEYTNLSTPSEDFGLSPGKYFSEFQRYAVLGEESPLPSPQTTFCSPTGWLPEQLSSHSSTQPLKTTDGSCDGGVQSVSKKGRKRGRPRLYQDDSPRKQRQPMYAIPSPPCTTPTSLTSPTTPDGSSPDLRATTTATITDKIRVRNKEASSRYRQRTQATITKAEAEERLANGEHKVLRARLDELREEVFELKTELLKQASCGCPLIRGYLKSATNDYSANCDT